MGDGEGFPEEMTFDWALKDKLRRLVQDGGVEGHALTPSCESSGITTNC